MIASRRVEEVMLREVDWENQREQELAARYAEWQLRERRLEMRRRLKTFLSWVALICFCLALAEALNLIVRR